MRISVFDIGGTWIKHALFDGERLSETSYIPTEAHLGSAQMLDKVASVLKDELEAAPLDAVGISTRGQVNPENGIIVYDPPEIFPDYTGTNLIDGLRSRLGTPDLPITAENDANCAAAAEAAFGAAKKFPDSITLTFGTGIGGGIVLNGKILHGNRYSAGEFGMMYLPDETGCPVFWEQLASPQVLKESPDLWTKRAAMGLASVIHIFNPSCLVLGGGLMEVPERFDAVCSQVYPLLAPGFEQVVITRAQLGNNAGMMGAAALAMSALK